MSFVLSIKPESHDQTEAAKEAGMIRSFIRLMIGATALVLSLAAVPASAQNVAGRFDYYVLALSWAPSWCRSTDDPRDSNSCDIGRKTGFTVHGLWPQSERGWPSNCPSNFPGPSRAETRAMIDLMGSSGLAWYQWRKHGRCSGLSATAYFDLMKSATEQVKIPEIFAQLHREVSLHVSR